jgi:hypothetical protein
VARRGREGERMAYPGGSSPRRSRGAGQGTAWTGWAVLGSARQGMERQWHTPRFESWGRTHGVEWRGTASRGRARRGMRSGRQAPRFEPSALTHGGTRKGQVRRGDARHGEAGRAGERNTPRFESVAPTHDGARLAQARRGAARQGKAEERPTPGFKSLASTEGQRTTSSGSIRNRTPAQHLRKGTGSGNPDDRNRPVADAQRAARR